MTGLRVHELEVAEHARWDDVVKAHGPLFCSAWWHEAWGMPATVVVASAGDEIVGGIALAVRRRAGVLVQVRPPWTPYNAAVVAPSRKQGSFSQAAHRRQVTEELIQALPRMAVHDVIHPPDQVDVLPWLWHGLEVDAAFTYVLPTDRAGSWQDGMARKARTALRAAHRTAVEQDLTVSEERTPIDDLLPLLADTQEVKGFRAGFGGPELLRWWSATAARDAGTVHRLRAADGTLLAASVRVHDGRWSYYVAGGMSNEVRRGSTLNLLLVESMIDASHRDGLHFDFEGSSLPGVEQFFRSLGGELRPCLRVLGGGTAGAVASGLARVRRARQRRRASGRVGTDGS